MDQTCFCEVFGVVSINKQQRSIFDCVNDWTCKLSWNRGAAVAFAKSA